MNRVTGGLSVRNDAAMRGMRLHGAVRVLRAGMCMLPPLLGPGSGLAGENSRAAASPVRSVAFDVHGGYFVSNRFEPDAPASFVALKDQGEFDKVFGVAMVMRDRSHRLPPGAFDGRMVVAAIRRGNAVVTYKVESVEAEGRGLVVRYAAKSEPGGTAEFACPLIVSVARGDYDIVRFVENGKEAGKVKW